MKSFFAITTALLFIINVLNTSCRPTKNLTKITEKKDSIVKVIEPAKTSNTDSLALVETTFNKILANKIVYNTFTAKARMEYEDGVSKVPDVNIFIRIKTDSAIWINVEKLSINVARLLITKDSVLFLNKYENEYMARSLNYIKEISGIAFDFKTIEDILVGNPVFIAKPVNFFQKNEKSTSLSFIGSLFKHFLTIDNNNFTISHSKLDDVNLSQNRTCDLTYEDYEQKDNFFFSNKRSIVISEKNKIQIDLKFKSFSFNEPVSFPFSIPKNVKKK